MKLIPRLDLTVVDLGGVEKISRGFRPSAVRVVDTSVATARMAHLVKCRCNGIL